MPEKIDKKLMADESTFQQADSRHDRRAFISGTIAALITGKILDAEAAGSEPKIEEIREGNRIGIRASHADVNLLHTPAYKRFEGLVESYIKPQNNAYTVGNLDVRLSYKNDLYTLQYTCSISPAGSRESTHRVVAMEGTIHEGKNAKVRVQNENARKVHERLQLMENDYPHTQWKYWKNDKDEETILGRDGNIIYHEAILIKAARR